MHKDRFIFVQFEYFHDFAHFVQKYLCFSVTFKPWTSTKYSILVRAIIIRVPSNYSYFDLLASIFSWKIATHCDYVNNYVFPKLDFLLKLL